MKDSGRYLAGNHGRDDQEAWRIWCFGSESTGPSAVVDVIKAVQ